jgi:hypothetical protein
VITRQQLLGHGVNPSRIDRRIAQGRLHPVWRGIFAVGRPQLTRAGWWSAAVSACGDDAVLSHLSASELWRIRRPRPGHEVEPVRASVIHVSVPEDVTRRLDGIRVHRRRELTPLDRTQRNGIRVTTPPRTLIDLGTTLPMSPLEAAVNEADRLDLIDPEALRLEVERHPGMEGVPALRRILDRRTFTLTDSELERRFLRLMRRAVCRSP